jgi:hypothetical protein
MEVTMLLCDWAEEINGKLYIMGGGWNRVVANRPVSIGLGVLVQVPWDQANVPHQFGIRLVTEDGAEVKHQDRPVSVEGRMEVGRPPGSRRGSPLNVPLAFMFNGLVVSPGSYNWQCLVDDQPLASVRFDATEEIAG